MNLKRKIAYLLSLNNIMSLSLTGKPGSRHQLSGKINENIYSIPYQIKKLKIRILNLFWLPLLSKQWQIIQKNLFLLDGLKKKVEQYYRSYRLDDLLLYKDLLFLLEYLVEQQVQLESMEKQLYQNPKNQLISMVYRTTMIKLKPEYELYDHILGKPLREKQESYREEIINEIQKWILLEDVSYQKIHDHILETFVNKTHS